MEAYCLGSFVLSVFGMCFFFVSRDSAYCFLLFGFLLVAPRFFLSASSLCSLRLRLAVRVLLSAFRFRRFALCFV